MAENRIDILINSMTNNNGFNAAIKGIQDITSATKKFQSLTEQAARANLVPNVSKDGTTTFRNLAGSTVGYNDALQKISKANEEFAQKNRLASESSKMVDKALKRNQQSLKETEKALQKVGNTFSMEFLGILFFGMQIKMLFQSLAKSTVSSFMKITEGVTSSGQAINALTANWELLKFSVGSAIANVLELLVPILLPIIEKITDWIEQNQTLVGWLIIAGIVLGTVLFVVGSLAIGIEALINVIAKMSAGTSILTKGFMAWTAEAAAAMGWGFVFSTILIWIGIIIAIVAVLYAAWVTNFGGIQEFVKGTFGIIWEVIKTVLGAVWNVIKLFFGLVLAIFEGDWGKVVAILIEIWKTIAGLIYKAAMGVAMIIFNAFTFVLNILKDIFFGILKLMQNFRAGAVNIFLTLGQKLLELIAKPFDAIADRINNFINTFSKVPGFGWLKNLEVPKAEEVIGGLEGIKDALAALNQEDIAELEALDKSLTLDFFNADDFKDGSKAIDDALSSVTESLAGFLGVQDKLKSLGESTAPIESPIDKVSVSLDNFDSKAKVASEASAAITQQNALELASWQDKNREIERNNQLLEKSAQLASLLNSGDTSGFYRSAGNFVNAPR